MRRVEALGGVTIFKSITQAFTEAIQTGLPVVVTGSFYTVGEVRELLICPGWSS
jgi:folylpolyglutamate synthase/dihydropteroate synthase